MHNFSTYSKEGITRCKWDTDRALQSTHEGKLGKYQLYIFCVVCLLYAVAESWVSGFVFFNAIPPKSLQCFNISNITSEQLKTIIINSSFIDQDSIENGSLLAPDWSQQGVLTPVQVYRDFNVSDKEARNIHVEFGLLCGEEYKVQFSRIGYILFKNIGCIMCGRLADNVGRKITLIGASFVCYTMILFQILSEDFVSYCFFILFIGLSAGGVVVVSVTMISEMFSTKYRTVACSGLLMVAFVFDLCIPWLASSIGWWKLLQGICGLPLLLASVLYWRGEETVYYYFALRQYPEAIRSLERIADYNGVDFHMKFKEAKLLLESKKSKKVQCDFQPLLRIQDIPKLREKYPTFNFADIMDQDLTKNKLSFFWKMLNELRGNRFHPNRSQFKVTDFLHSGIILSYIVLICGLWFVNGVTYSSLESHELSWRLKTNPYIGYCFQSLTGLVICLVNLPILHKIGRRWATFCLYLIGEVCLLASIVAKIEREFTSVTLSLIYLIGKGATYGAYVVISILTVEIFPTSLRATALGIGLLIRSFGVIIADPELLNFHDWTSRLIYGFLSLLMGSMVLFLPEVKHYPLSRTIAQVELIPSNISKRIKQFRNSKYQRKLKKHTKESHVHFDTDKHESRQALPDFVNTVNHSNEQL